MTESQYEGAGISEAYVRFRPTYPQELFDAIMDYHGKSVSKSDSQCGVTTALDLGCGTGQATQPLIKYFKHVTGVDVSPTQIEVARGEFPDISFREEMGEDLSFLPDNSVDLVTAAQAIHWMDRNRVYPEVKRVLKPGGTMAVFMYNFFKLTNPEAESVYRQVWSEILWNFWDTEKATHILEDYRNLNFPFPERQRVDDITRKEPTTPDRLIGILASTVAYKSLLKCYPDSDLMEKTKARLEAVLDDTSTPVLDVQVDFTLLLGRNNE